MQQGQTNLPPGSDQSLLVTLFRLSTLVATELDPDQLGYKICVAVTDAVAEVDAAMLWLYRAATDRIEFAALHTAAPMATLPIDPLYTVGLRLSEGWVGQALLTGEPLLLEDAAAFYRAIAATSSPAREILEQFMVALAPICALAIVPLLIGQERIGALVLVNTTDRLPLHGDGLAIFQTFANQLAVVLRNAQLYEQLELQHRHLQALDAVVTAISGAADLRQLLRDAMQVVLNVINAGSGGIALLDGRTEMMVLEVYQNLAPDLISRLYVVPVNGSPYEEVVRFGQPLVQPLHTGHPWSRFVGARDPEAVALLPLLAGGTVVGVLIMLDRLALLQQLTWSSLMAMGAQIGFAVANAHLFAATSSERRRLAGVISSIAEGVLICDGNGDIVMANEAAGGILSGVIAPGTTLEQLTETFQLRDVNEAPLFGATMPLGRALRGDVFNDYEILARRDERDIVLSTSGAPLLTDTGTVDGGVVVIRDITAHKEHDTARDEFLAIAAHELRAPLAAIKGYSDLLVKREGLRPDATDRDVRGSLMLSRQVDHLVMLIDNLLDVSRVDAGRLQLALQPTDLMALVEASVERVRVGDGRHEFQVIGPPTLVFPLDQLRIQQVLTNLLSNAARYSPANTLITIEVSADARAATVAVRDQGPGISDDVQRKIFQRYFRASTAGATSGLGLGLYISREIVVRHGGRLGVRSVAGQGATFLVEMPLEPGATG